MLVTQLQPLKILTNLSARVQQTSRVGWCGGRAARSSAHAYSMGLLSIGSMRQGMYKCTALTACHRYVLFCSHDVCLCRYTQVSLMLLLSKLRSDERGERHLTNSTKSPVAEDQLCDSLNAMGLEEGSSGTEIAALVDLADI
jgi:hypothetical protein